MSNSTEQQKSSAQVIGAQIADAKSALTEFCIFLKDDNVLHLEATGTADDPAIVASLKKRNQLQEIERAVCSVDWSWIAGSKISAVQMSGTKLVRLVLDPAGPIDVQVSVWKGSPFLSFQPCRPRK